MAAPDLPRGGLSTDALLADVGARVADLRPVLLGGVSRGAHLAATWAADAAAAGTTVRGLVLALPAWSGPPGRTARLSAQAADQVEAVGVGAALAAAREGGALAWVLEELEASWPRYDPAELVADLRAVARSPAPTPAVLRRVRVPAGVVGLVDDPFHPVEVARGWAERLRTAALEEVAVDLPGGDVATIGRAAVRALARAAP